jgi:hypothetical protein
MRVADLPRLFRPPTTETFFPADALVPRTRSFIEGLGLSWEAVKVDAKASPTKSPRPFALAVRIPSDVRLSLNPTGGLREQVLTLQEAAIAWHWALSKETEFALNQLNPPFVGKMSGELFAHVGTDPRWLQSTAGLSPELAAPLAKTAALYELFVLRRHCARILFAQERIKLAVTDATGVQNAYRKTHSRAYGFPLTDDETSRAWLEASAWEVSVDALRANLAAAQLAETLTTANGSAWWSSTKSGESLKALWAQGTGTESVPVQRTGERIKALGEILDASSFSGN